MDLDHKDQKNHLFFIIIRSENVLDVVISLLTTKLSKATNRISIRYFTLWVTSVFLCPSYTSLAVFSSPQKVLLIQVFSLAMFD